MTVKELSSFLLKYKIYTTKSSAPYLQNQTFHNILDLHNE
jgi:hypothetical protein